MARIFHPRIFGYYQNSLCPSSFLLYIAWTFFQDITLHSNYRSQKRQQSSRKWQQMSHDLHYFLSNIDHNTGARTMTGARNHHWGLKRALWGWFSAGAWLKMDIHQWPQNQIAAPDSVREVELHGTKHQQRHALYIFISRGASPDRKAHVSQVGVAESACSTQNGMIQFIGFSNI